MGAHGALQLALNYPGEFTAVGTHSLVLRRFGSARTQKPRRRSSRMSRRVDASAEAP